MIFILEVYNTLLITNTSKDGFPLRCMVMYKGVRGRREEGREGEGMREVKREREGTGEVKGGEKMGYSPLTYQ